MISFKDHSLTRFGVWYQRVLFVPAGRGGSRGMVPGVRTPPPDDLRLSN